MIIILHINPYLWFGKQLYIVYVSIPLIVIINLIIPRYILRTV